MSSLGEANGVRRFISESAVQSGSLWTPARLVFLCVVLLLASANPPSASDDWERRGDAALATGNYSEALRHFDQAAETSDEPGRVVEKLAAAYFHLGKYRDAERAYRAALESESSTQPRALTHYNLGVTLLFGSNGHDVGKLADAINQFERCLRLAEVADAVHADARHNLELAKLLWKRASGGSAPPPDEAGTDPARSGANAAANQNSKEPGASSGAPTTGDGPRTSAALTNAEPRPAGEHGSPSPGVGSKPVTIPESEQTQPLTPAEARDLLRQAAERIARDRRALQKGTGNGGIRAYPDW